MRPTFTLSDRLAKAMAVAQISADVLARELDVHPNTVLNYASGRTRPPRSTLILWSQITDVDLDWLIGDDATSDPGERPSRCVDGRAERPTRETGRRAHDALPLAA